MNPLSFLKLEPSSSEKVAASPLDYSDHPKMKEKGAFQS